MKKQSLHNVIFLMLLTVLLSCEQNQVAKGQEATKQDSVSTKSTKPKSILKPAGAPSYSWLSAEKIDWKETVANRIAAPKGYIRDSVQAGSFAEWLRFLPLLEAGSKVMYFNGEEKPYQQFHESVVNIDIGKQDLQQCADATMRLRAEYQYAVKDFANIRFNFTNGDPALYSKWRQGYGITIANNRLKWITSSKSNASYTSFKRYMRWVFMYAGTASLSKEVKKIPDLKQMEIGDIIIQGGFPGHAVIVLDMAHDPKTGKKVFMLAQSYMPAQSIHVLKNMRNSAISPWYSIDECLEEGAILTAQWNFLVTDLGRFKY